MLSLWLLKKFWVVLIQVTCPSLNQSQWSWNWLSWVTCSTPPGRRWSLSPTTSTKLGRERGSLKEIHVITRKKESKCPMSSSSFFLCFSSAKWPKRIAYCHAQCLIHQVGFCSIQVPNDLRPPVNSRRQSRWKSALVLNFSAGPLPVPQTWHLPHLQSQFPPTWLAVLSLSVRLLHQEGHHPLARLSANGRQETQPRQRRRRMFWLLSACCPPLSNQCLSFPKPSRKLFGKGAFGKWSLWGLAFSEME